ncbi:CMD domain-containing protein [Nocardia salmonicida]|uniref:CMD domain-containing protein n=1 Tax=Nocardia salmonicida TaxID=53431 RepID=UPI003640EF19
MTDVIDAVLGTEAAAGVAAVRQSRPVVVEHTQGVHDALFDGQAGRAFGRARLAAIAAHIAALGQAEDLAAYYVDLAKGAGTESDSAGDAKLAAALRHAVRLTEAPATSTRAHIDILLAAGLSETDIVTVSQLVGFVNYQIRLLAGLALIGDRR